MEPTFVFDESGMVYAYADGKVIAAAQDADALEAKLAFDDPQSLASPAAPGPPGMGQSHDPSADPNMNQGTGVCPTCGQPTGPDDQFCAHCGSPVQLPADQAPDAMNMPPAPGADPSAPPEVMPQGMPRATHITTPSGLKGQLLGRVKGLWGDQVTIRLENGRIAKFDVMSEDQMEYSTEEPTVHSPLAALQARLDEVPSGTKASLQARVRELKAIKREAQNYFREASYVDESTINNITILADHELREVSDALTAVEDQEAFAAPAPFSTGVVEQESLGGNDGSWIDDIAETIATENEGQDFDQMIAEQPDLMVTEMPTEVLSESDVVADEALEYVTSKTAGLAGPIQEFRQAFLDRVEAARLAELKRRLAEDDADDEDADTEDDEEDKDGEFPFQKDSSTHIDTDDSLFW